MANYISFRDIRFAPWTTSVTIIAVTDVPCHLWLRLTTTAPQIHKKTSLVRGLRLLDDFRYCFTSYEDNEQLEAGDTLIHSWVKPAWAYCVTKWLYLWGYVAGVVSASTSPVFKYHNNLKYAPLPMFQIFLEPWDAGEEPWPPMFWKFTEPWDTEFPAFTQKVLEPWDTP